MNADFFIHMNQTLVVLLFHKCQIAAVQKHPVIFFQGFHHPLDNFRPVVSFSGNHGHRYGIRPQLLRKVFHIDINPDAKNNVVDLVRPRTHLREDSGNLFLIGHQIIRPLDAAGKSIAFQHIQNSHRPEQCNHGRFHRRNFRF